VHLLTSANNREGNSTIAFDESVLCDAGTEVSYHRTQVDGLSSQGGELRHTAERKTRVSRTGWEESQEAPSERVE